MKVNDALALVGVALVFAHTEGQTPNPCTYTSPTGATVRCQTIHWARTLAVATHSHATAVVLGSLSSLNRAEGTTAVTPLGNVRINPCQKVTLCDAMQTNSACCVQVRQYPKPTRVASSVVGMTRAFLPGERHQAPGTIPLDLMRR
jgi:hypothetical protein